MNLLDLQPDMAARRPKLIKLSSDEVALIPFTADVESVQLHYVDDPSINAYIRCNGNDCDLCRIGRTIATKYLLPVFDPIQRAVALLPMTDNMKPGSLTPQMTRETNRGFHGDKRIVFIRKIDNHSFDVRSTVLPATVDDGTEQVKAFLDLLENGGFEMADAYATYSNDQLRRMSGIREQLQLRGLIKE